MINIPNLNRGFAALRRAGYKTGRNLSEPGQQAFISLSGRTKTVYYSKETAVGCDQEALNARRGMRYTARKFLYLSWSGDGHEIVRILKGAGVELGAWDGTEAQCISVVVHQVEG